MDGQDNMTDMNAAMCLVCGAVLRSRSRHDFQQCGCSNMLHVDGGEDYIKRGAVDMAKVQEIHTEEEYMAAKLGPYISKYGSKLKEAYREWNDLHGRME